MRLEEIGLSEWESALPDSGFEVFHAPRALAVLDDHTDAELRLYAAYKGQEVVGMVPLFVTENALGRAAMSPPPGFVVPRLGPLVMPTSPKQSKRESVNREFADLLLEAVDADSGRTLLRLECPTAYTDPRPFEWGGLEVEQSFTYLLDVPDDPGAVMDGFARGLRREIRKAGDLPITIEREGVDGARPVFDEVAAHYEDQGETFPLSWPYVRDVVARLEERARVYVARGPDEEYLGGIIALYSNDAAAFWLGGVRSEYEGVSVNSRIHWRVIEDVAEDPPVDSVSTYDLVGANTPRLCRYKAKFGADLVPYYTVESEGVTMSVAKRAYSLVGRRVAQR